MGAARKRKGQKLEQQSLEVTHLKQQLQESAGSIADCKAQPQAADMVGAQKTQVSPWFEADGLVLMVHVLVRHS